MSSPLPGSQTVTEHAYQINDSGDHIALINHTCTCYEKSNGDGSSSENTISHCHNMHNKNSQLNHNLINLKSHGQTSPGSHTHAVHVHVHSNSVTSTNIPKTSTSTCNCHFQTENQSNLEIIEQAGSNCKLEDDRIEISPLPPALPPRPPPRPRIEEHGTLTSRSRVLESNQHTGGIRKYVFWCCACGGLSTLLGALFLAVYFLLRTYTSTLAYFETIPTFVPAAMLILTGLCVISLARRKNRYSYLIKVCGLCCLVCALTCVLVTITTTVIHMNRLQTLRECVYTQKTRTCTCYSVLLEAHASTDEGMRFVFDSTPDCEVIHGALYSCLRAMFGLSVSGILVCIFSCMLVYQLLSHEKKKMYWEQLELRCRSLYQQHGGTLANSTHSSVRVPSVQTATYCSCCEECRYPPLTSASHVYPWDTQHALERFWTPGRIGNFYSPNPGEDLSQQSVENRVRETSTGGWNWRRLPWNRGNSNQQSISNRNNSLTYEGAVSNSDSQYGFNDRHPMDATNTTIEPISNSTSSYSALNNRPIGGVYLWGPPPPYSNPNSPARLPFHSSNRYHHIHQHPHGHNAHCQVNQNIPDTSIRRNHTQHLAAQNYENTSNNDITSENNESTDTSSCAEQAFSHTLPFRKSKKKNDSILSNQCLNQSENGINIQFHQGCHTYEEETLHNPANHEYDEMHIRQSHNSENHQQCKYLPRLQGVENAAFQTQECAATKTEPAESEVYFADVSSCCNTSVKNDGQESSLYDEALEVQKPRLLSVKSLHKHSTNGKELPNNNQILQNFQENISSSTATEDEEYLVHRLGNRQMSTRSRLPFPLPNVENVDLNAETYKQLISKDISQNSLCSNLTTPLTESTDDGLSPSSPNMPSASFTLDSSITTSTEKLQPTQQRTFLNTHIEHFLAPDAQYEAMQQQNSQKKVRQQYNITTSSITAPTFNNLTNTISNLNNYGQNCSSGNYITENFSISSIKASPSNNLNSSLNRNVLDTNISNLMLGVNSVGLLYNDNPHTDDDTQGHGCHSDGMDSGWQSGSEKIEAHEKNETTNQRPVNV